MSSTARRSVSYGGCRRFVDQVTIAKALNGERRIDRMGFIPGNRPSKDMRRSRRCFESSGSPSAVHIQAGYRRLGDDGRSVRRHVDDAAPIAHHSQATKVGKQFANRIQSVRVDMQRTTLGIRGVGISTCTDDQFALVRLTDVSVNGVGHDDAGKYALDGLGNQCLQRVALQGYVHAGHAHNDAGVTGRRYAHLARLNHAARGFHCLDGAAGVAPNAGYLAILNDVDAQRIGRARIAPGNGIVPRSAAASLQCRTQYRVADVGFYIERRAEFFGLDRLPPFIVDSVTTIRMYMTLEHLNVVYGVRKHHDDARGEHDVVIEDLREVLPELHRMIVKRRAFTEQIVRTDDGGIASGVAATDPALFQHRDIRQSMFLGQIVCGAQTMAAAADDDGVVASLRFRLAPLFLPAGVARQSAPDERKPGE